MKSTTSWRLVESAVGWILVCIAKIRQKSTKEKNAFQLIFGRDYYKLPA